MSNDTNTKKEVNGSCGAIQALFQKVQEICNSDQVISSAEQLEELATNLKRDTFRHFVSMIILKSSEIKGLLTD